MTTLENHEKVVHVDFDLVFEDNKVKKYVVKETGQHFESEQSAITAARKYLRAVVRLMLAETEKID